MKKLRELFNKSRKNYADTRELEYKRNVYKKLKEKEKDFGEGSLMWWDVPNDLKSPLIKNVAVISIDGGDTWRVDINGVDYVSDERGSPEGLFHKAQTLFLTEMGVFDSVKGKDLDIENHQKLYENVKKDLSNQYQDKITIPEYNFLLNSFGSFENINDYHDMFEFLQEMGFDSIKEKDRNPEMIIAMKQKIQSINELIDKGLIDDQSKITILKEKLIKRLQELESEDSTKEKDEDERCDGCGFWFGIQDLQYETFTNKKYCPTCWNKKVWGNDDSIKGKDYFLEAIAELQKQIKMINETLSDPNMSIGPNKRIELAQKKGELMIRIEELGSKIGDSIKESDTITEEIQYLEKQIQELDELIEITMNEDEIDRLLDKQEHLLNQLSYIREAYIKSQ